MHEEVIKLLHRAMEAAPYKRGSQIKIGSSQYMLDDQFYWTEDGTLILAGANVEAVRQLGDEYNKQLGKSC